MLAPGNCNERVQDAVLRWLREHRTDLGAARGAPQHLAERSGGRSGQLCGPDHTSMCSRTEVARARSRWWWAHA